MMCFDEFCDGIDDMDTYFDNQLDELTMDEIEFTQNIFSFLNSGNFLCVPAQEYLV
jgi:hypothetical protein